MAIQTQHALFLSIEFEPLAQLRMPLSAFKDAGAVFETHEDDLDSYEFAVFRTETTNHVFAIAHYDSQSEMAVDLYVPRGTVSNSDIEPFLVRVAEEFRIPSKLFVISETAEPFIARPYRSDDRDIYGSGLPVIPVPVIHWANDQETFGAGW